MQNDKIFDLTLPSYNHHRPCRQESCTYPYIPAWRNSIALSHSLRNYDWHRSPLHLDVFSMKVFWWPFRLHIHGQDEICSRSTSERTAPSQTTTCMAAAGHYYKIPCTYDIEKENAQCEREMSEPAGDFWNVAILAFEAPVYLWSGPFTLDPPLFLHSSLPWYPIPY